MQRGLGSLLVLVVGTSCTPFESGSSSSSSNVNDGGGRPAADGGLQSEAGVSPSPAGCALEEILYEPFNTPGLPGWARVGVDVVTTEANGPTPKHDSYGSLSHELLVDPSVTRPVFISRSFPRKVKAARLTYDVAHRAIANYTEFGCSLSFHHKATAPTKTASVYLAYNAGSTPYVFDAIFLRNGVSVPDFAKDTDLTSLFVVNQWHTVSYDMQVNAQGQIDATATLNGGARRTIDPFAFDAEVDSVELVCGITLMIDKGGATLSEIALDEIHLSVCN